MRKRSEIPCLVMPPKLQFSRSVNGHKQVLTVYNPLNYVLSFKILSTNPRAYKVEPSSGSLAALSSTDVVVRLRGDAKGGEAKHSGGQKRDKFCVRVENKEVGVGGETVVAVEHVRGAVSAKQQRAGLEALAKKISEHTETQRDHAPPAQKWTARASPFILGLVVVAFMSTDDDRVFSYTSRLYLAFFVGVVTMLVQFGVC